MSVIHDPELRKHHPINRIHYNLLAEKGLGKEEPNERYFMLSERYKHFFEQYIMDNLPLAHVDRNMQESNLGFCPIKEADMDWYQKSSGMGLRYLYLRNDFYIELLERDELDFLEDAAAYNQQVAEFIRHSFRRVIDPCDEPTSIFYGPENGQFLCDSDTIVLGVRYDEFNSELEDVVFAMNFLEKQRILSQLSSVLEEYAVQALGAKLRFIQYNEVSVKQADPSHHI